MISTSDLHLLGSHFEQYPDYQPRNLKAQKSETSTKDHQETGNLGLFHFPILSFGFVFVLLGITCTITSIGIFSLFTHTHYMYRLHQDMDIVSWSARLLSMSLSLQSGSKSVGDSLMGVAFVEALATSRKESASAWWRNALELDVNMMLKLEVEAMPFESAVLRLEDWVYNVARL